MTDAPAQESTPLEVLQDKVEGQRRHGYTADGKQKRMLLNVFDMNGIGHIRSVCHVFAP